MTPPQKILSSCDETAASCSLPPQPAYSEPVSTESHCPSTETVIAVQNGVEYVQDDVRQISYSRPVDNLFRSSRVLVGVPAATSSDRRAALALGRALERVIDEMEHSGETIPTQAYALRDMLNRGELPSHQDVTDNPFFNQSLIDTRLDAVIHAVAVKVAGENQLHQTALALSLEHYFSQSPNNPADRDIRQGLIVALSSDTQGREILAQATGNSPSIRNEIARAMIQSAAQGLAAGAAGQAGAAAGTAASAEAAGAGSASTALSAGVVATRVAALSSPSANALLTGAGLIMGALGFDRGPLPPYQESLLWPAPIGGLGGPTYAPPLVLRDLPFLNDVFGSHAPQEASSDSRSAGESSPSRATPEAPAGRSRGVAPESPAPSQPAHSESSEPAGVRGILPHALQSIGTPSYATQVILATLPSPFTLAAVALQGGYAAALLSQTSVQPQHSSVYSYAPYAIAAVSSASETHSDSDASHSDSGHGQSGGQGQQQQDENPRDERQPEQDVYLA